MEFTGLTVSLKCSECGNEYAVQVEGTEPEDLPEKEVPLQKTIPFRCLKCGHSGEMDIDLRVLGQG